MRSATKEGQEYLHCTWKDVENQVQEIVDHMIIAGAKPEAILAVGKGGLIPAAMIAHLFSSRTARIPLVDCVYAKSYHGKVRGQVVTAGLHECKERLKHLSFKGQILIVDDIADSGCTLEHLRNQFPRASFATLVYKHTSSIEPDFCGHQDKDGKRYWYVFPWERVK